MAGTTAVSAAFVYGFLEAFRSLLDILYMFYIPSACLFHTPILMLYLRASAFEPAQGA